MSENDRLGLLPRDTTAQQTLTTYVYLSHVNHVGSPVPSGSSILYGALPVGRLGQLSC